MPEPQRADGGASRRAGHRSGSGLWVHLGGTDAWVWEDLIAPVIAATTPLDVDQEPLLLLAERIADCFDALGEPEAERPANLKPSPGLTRVGGAAEALLVHVELAEDRGIDVARAASSDHAEAFQYRRLRADLLCTLLGYAGALPSWLLAAESLSIRAAKARSEAEAAAEQKGDAPGAETPVVEASAAATMGSSAASAPARPSTPRVEPVIPATLDVQFSAPRVPLLYWLVAVVDPEFPGARMVEPHVFKRHLIGAETREPLVALLRGQWPAWPGFDPEDALPLRGAAAPRLESEPVSAWAVTPAEWAVRTAARFRAQLRRFVHLRALERTAPARHRDLVEAWSPDLDDAMLADYDAVMAAHPWEPCDAECWAYLSGDRDDAPNCPWLSTPDARMEDVLSMLRGLRASLDTIADHPRGGAYLLLTRDAAHPNADAGTSPMHVPGRPATARGAGERAPGAVEGPTLSSSTDLAIPWQLLENTP